MLLIIFVIIYIIIGLIFSLYISCIKTNKWELLNTPYSIFGLFLLLLNLWPVFMLVLLYMSFSEKFVKLIDFLQNKFNFLKYKGDEKDE